MRQIGTIADFEAAQRLQDYLIAEGAACSLDEADDGYGVWIHDDDRIPAAKAALEHFLAHPNDERYLTARTRADTRLKEQAAQRKAARRNTVSMSRRWDSGGAREIPLTFGIILICLFVFVETYLMGDEAGFYPLLLFSTDGTWKAILEDHQYWRLLSPSIMHGNVFHILFNLLGWYQLAGMVEQRKGSGYLLILTVMTALSTDILQFTFVKRPFLGLSGVVFGIFGYAWMKGKLDPADGIGVPPSTVVNALVFYLLCWIGAFGNIANFGHMGGLLMGVTIGCLSAWWRNRRSV